MVATPAAYNETMSKLDTPCKQTSETTQGGGGNRPARLRRGGGAGEGNRREYLYAPLAFQNPFPSIVDSVANYRPNLNYLDW